MRGMTHNDRIETTAIRHAEGNKGEKIGVERGFGAFDGGKLLKRKGQVLSCQLSVLKLDRLSVRALSVCDL